MSLTGVSEGRGYDVCVLDSLQAFNQRFPNVRTARISEGQNKKRFTGLSASKYFLDVIELKRPNPGSCPYKCLGLPEPNGGYVWAKKLEIVFA